MKFLRNTSADTELDEPSMLLEYRKTGNLEILGKLYEKYMPLVFGLCLKYFKDEEQSKDAVMQIFEKLIIELRKTEVKNFKGWLSFVVRNYCIGELRKNKNKHFVSEAYLDFEVNDASLEEEEKIARVNDELMLDYMKEALPQLKENQRNCVELFYLKNQSYQQISNTTQFSINEVKSYIQNGKRNLKLLIEEKIKNKKNAA